MDKPSNRPLAKAHGNKTRPREAGTLIVNLPRSEYQVAIHQVLNDYLWQAVRSEIGHMDTATSLVLTLTRPKGMASEPKPKPLSELVGPF